MSIRAVKKILRPQPTLEGAGVKLQRGFGFGDPKEFDPFLLFDDFRNDNPEEYLAGFPWHPHRGIETITYVLAGQVDHGDSLGNSGTLSGGDVQWMTAGSGIIHQEMPKGDAQGRMHGFQLWANLPSSLKMTTPRYQDVAGKDIPDVVDDDGTRGAGGVRQLLGHERPGRRHRRRSDLPRRVRAARQTQDAAGRNHAPRLRVRLRRIGHVPQRVGPARGENRRRRLRQRIGGRRPRQPLAVLFDRGDEVTVQAGEQGIRFLLVSGKPIEEPVAWYGPIVMNTEDELRLAVAEMRAGTFIKHGK